MDHGTNGPVSAVTEWSNGRMSVAVFVSLMVFVGAVSVSAQKKPDFSGTWVTVSPADAALMARLATPSYAPVLTAPVWSHHFKFQCLEFTQAASVGAWGYNLVELGDGSVGGRRRETVTHRRLRSIRMDPARLLRFRRARVRAGNAGVLRSRAPVGNAERIEIPASPR